MGAPESRRSESSRERDLESAGGGGGGVRELEVGGVGMIQLLVL